MDIILASAAFSGLLLAGMLVLLEVGRRIGVRRALEDPQGAREGVGAVDAALFALMGLMLAFTFSGAAGRFDLRRSLIIDETNDIGTAWLRVDVLPENLQPPLRDAFRRYVDLRIEIYRKLPDIDAALAELAQSNRIQGELWRLAVAACAAPEGERARMLLLPAINQMIDITTTRTAMTRMHPPAIVFVMLGVLALTSALLVGIAMGGGKQRSWIHMIGFAALISVTTFMIIDLEYPRRGLIRVDSFDQLLVDLRRSMD